MKIGIITLWGTQDNYGQVLQAYALQHYLIARGHNVYHIPYQVKGKNFKEQIKVFTQTPFQRINHLLNRFIFNRKEKQLGRKFTSQHPRQFNEFRNNELNIYPQTYIGKKELDLYPPEADTYITGSDQVWNVEIIKDTQPYFLNFGNSQTQRIAYAVSFGGKAKNNRYLKQLKPLLEKFKGISVREKSGIDICKQAGYQGAIQVLDPTLLLPSTEYLKLIKGHPIEVWKESKKLFGYFLNFKTPSDIHWNTILDCCKKQNINPRITISSGARPAYDRLNYTNYYTPDIYNWINSINEADYIITNSFHGLAFAILFKKKFLFISLQGRIAKMNDRITDILMQTNLLNRIYDPNKEMFNQLNQEINWEKSEQILDICRKEASVFFTNHNI